MKKLVFVLSVLVIIIGVGFYRGWFTVNPEKVQQDEIRAEEEVRELMHKVKAKSGDDASPAKEAD